MTQQPAPPVVARASGGAGSLTILLIAFIALKLAGVITWSWWWVTAPAWIPGGTVVAISLAALLRLAAFALNRRRARRRS